MEGGREGGSGERNEGRKGEIKGHFLFTIRSIVYQASRQSRAVDTNEDPKWKKNNGGGRNASRQMNTS